MIRTTSRNDQKSNGKARQHTKETPNNYPSVVVCISIISQERLLTDNIQSVGQ